MGHGGHDPYYSPRHAELAEAFTRENLAPLKAAVAAMIGEVDDNPGTGA